ncbi:hypothetical protein SCHPADRAFT_582559 [Schizopora paradoxa]|uniref:Uncharacterized protein n=1 Tax=Schizopora paradoxa TaxID=27342 RepID=A0A0H2RHS9_9AGAM|nr:hypothetical protein SCHPADRAFT_582559 [Schizopora paradoxa]
MIVKTEREKSASEPTGPVPISREEDPNPRHPTPDSMTENDTASTTDAQHMDEEKIKADLPLELWIWGGMTFTEDSMPNVCFYIRVCKYASRLELRERFGASSRIMKVLKFEDLRNYSLRSSLVNNTANHFVAYVHINPRNENSAPITLKFSKDCKLEDYEFLLSSLRSICHVDSDEARDVHV